MPQEPLSSEGEIPSRLRRFALDRAKPTEGGLLFERDEGPFVLPWGRVRQAFAAALGEDHESRVGFQLVLNEHGSECQMVGFCHEDVVEAAQSARALLVALGSDVCDASLRTLAEEGVIARRYIEPEVFEEAVLEAVRFRATQ